MIGFIVTIGFPFHWYQSTITILGDMMAEDARNQAQLKDLQSQFEELKSDSERQFQGLMSDLKRLIVERCGTPLWISELSTMADEVRDRTILVKVHSQLDPISELGIYYVFSEIGMVEDARYLPAESGFHSQVRFRDKYSADWAFHYYNGKRLREGSYELEIHNVNDVIEWNAQRIAKFQDVLGAVDSPAVTNDGRLLAENLKNDKLLNNMEESTQIEAPDNFQIFAKEPSDVVALKVFDESPESPKCCKHESLDEIKGSVVVSDDDLSQDEKSTLVKISDELQVTYGAVTYGNEQPEDDVKEENALLLFSLIEGQESEVLKRELFDIITHK